ncbi:MAG: type IV secretion system protein [Phenylobacterium sp.]|uniref:type IV secretion system protein n=1 Tax=Phenylobacterium sp. TaxID=1871053 RepID=UPI002732DA7D|nr:type IV secretion system protein [Phenylobacterium sp.]MDP3749261.1 type IV secretion system protein [Phenylobacterium sp.]
MACRAPSADLGLVRGLLDNADCHSQALAAAGYGALTEPGGLAAGLLGAVLALYVAFQGWRLMAGDPPRLGAWTISLVKIGFVLALTSQWPVYQRLVHDLLISGPAEIAAPVEAGYREAVGLRGDTLADLQRAHTRLMASASAAVQAPPPPPGRLGPPGAENPAGDTLKMAAFLLLLSTLGPLVASRLLVAVVLAAGPLALLAAFFDRTRGVFFGWLQAGLWLTLAQVALVLLTAMETSLLSPHLRRLGEAHPGSAASVESANALLLVVSIFGLVGLGAIFGAALVARGLRPASIAAILRGRGSEPAAELRPAPNQAPAAAAESRAEPRSSDAGSRRETRAPAQLHGRRDARTQALAPGPVKPSAFVGAFAEAQAARRPPPRRSNAAMRREG